MEAQESLQSGSGSGASVAAGGAAANTPAEQPGGCDASACAGVGLPTELCCADRGGWRQAQGTPQAPCGERSPTYACAASRRSLLLFCAHPPACVPYNNFPADGPGSDREEHAALMREGLTKMGAGTSDPSLPDRLVCEGVG